MKNLAKATVFMSPSTFAVIIFGFIRAKLSAIYLGIDGVGIFSQINTFMNFALAVCSLSMYIGITKYLAESIAEKNEEERQAIISTSVAIQLVISIIFVVILSIFAKEISMYIFGKPGLEKLFLVALCGVPFTVLVTGFINPVFFGYMNYKFYTYAVILTTILSLAPFVILVMLVKLKGAFIYLLFNSLIAFLVYLFFYFKLNAKNRFKLYYIKKDTAIKLTKYGFVMFIAGSLTQFVFLSMRSIFINKVGIDANGFYQVVFAITSYYTPLLTNSLWGYFHPKMSSYSDKDATGRREEINHTIRLQIFLIVPIIFLVSILKKVIVLVLYTRDFLPSVGLFNTQLIGDFFYFLSFVFATSLLAMSYLRSYLVIVIAFNLIYFFTFLLFVDNLGVRSIVTAYALINIVIFAIHFIYHNKKIGFSFDTKNNKLIIYSILAISAIFFIPNSGIFYLYKICIIALWLAVGVTSEEKKKIIGLLSRGLSRII